MDHCPEQILANIERLEAKSRAHITSFEHQVGQLPNCSPNKLDDYFLRSEKIHRELLCSIKKIINPAVSAISLLNTYCSLHEVKQRVTKKMFQIMQVKLENRIDKCRSIIMSLKSRFSAQSELLRISIEDASAMGEDNKVSRLRALKKSLEDLRVELNTESQFIHNKLQQKLTPTQPTSSRNISIATVSKHFI